MKWYWNHCKRACGLLRPKDRNIKSDLLELYSFLIVITGFVLALVLFVVLSLTAQQIFG